jgi:hypothetical protein
MQSASEHLYCNIKDPRLTRVWRAPGLPLASGTIVAGSVRERRFAQGFIQNTPSATRHLLRYNGYMIMYVKIRTNPTHKPSASLRVEKDKAARHEQG